MSAGMILLVDKEKLTCCTEVDGFRSFKKKAVQGNLGMVEAEAGEL